MGGVTLLLQRVLLRTDAGLFLSIVVWNNNLLLNILIVTLMTIVVNYSHDSD